MRGIRREGRGDGANVKVGVRGVGRGCDCLLPLGTVVAECCYGLC